MGEEMTSSEKGDYSAAKVTAALLARGVSVSVPWGNSKRYDLIIDVANLLLRVQVKTARSARDGALQFSCTSQRRDKTEVTYRGSADVFAVYYPRYDEIYIVPVEDCGPTRTSLRIYDPKSNAPSIRWAKKYELDVWLGAWWAVLDSNQ